MVKLQDRFPAPSLAWIAAGGIESNLESHLVATGVLPADQAGLLVVLTRLQSATAEVQATIQRMLAPPDVPELVHAIDVSSYQSRDLTAILDGLEPRPTHVVVRLYQAAELPSQEHSLAQIESARANGCTVGAYVWLYAGLDPRSQVRDVLALAARAQLRIPVLWLDVEPEADGSLPDVLEIRTAIGACWLAGVRAGIYSGSWAWPKLGSPTEFAEEGVPLWTADYNGQPTLGVPLYGGWTEVQGHQYQGSPIDRSVFRGKVTR